MSKPVSYRYYIVDLSEDNSIGSGQRVTDQNEPIEAFSFMFVPAGATFTFSMGPSNDKIRGQANATFVGNACALASQGIFVQNAPQPGVSVELFVQYGEGGGSGLAVTAG